MNFKTKIFLATLSILVMTLILSSLMSILSFEKHYVNSLISTYELAGNNLKRKIEKSLLFGKPLDKFQGMQKLFQNVFDQNRHISMIWITGKNGEILYKGGKNKSESRPILGIGKSKLSASKKAETVLVRKRYITIVSLQDGAGQVVGRLHLSFPREVILDKVKDMIISNLNILWPIVVITSFCLILLLAILIFKPLKKELTEVSETFEKDNKLHLNDLKNNSRQVFDAGRAKEPSSSEIKKWDFYTAGFDVQKVKREMDVLKMQISSFITQSNKYLSNVEQLRQKQQEIFVLAEKLEQSEIKLEKDIQELNQVEKQGNILLLQTIIEESRNIREMIELIRYVTENMADVCTQDPAEQAG